MAIVASELIGRADEALYAAERMGPTRCAIGVLPRLAAEITWQPRVLPYCPQPRDVNTRQAMRAPATIRVTGARDGESRNHNDGSTWRSRSTCSTRAMVRR